MILTIISLEHQPARLTKLVTGFLLVTIKKNDTFLSFSHLIYPNPTLKFNRKSGNPLSKEKDAEGWFVEAALYL